MVIDVDNNLKGMSVAKVFEHKDTNIRLSSSSGGLFSELAIRVFKDGGVCFGAVFTENWQIKHICAKNEAQFVKMRKSKYVTSHLEGTFKEVESYLQLGTKVLFTGVPCQIASLKKALVQDYENLLTAEIVCHGCPRDDAWTMYLDEVVSKTGHCICDIKSIDFRDKTDGWESYRFTIAFKDGHTFSEPADKNLFMRLFLGNYTIKRGCFSCPFKIENTKADITMGDFWGMEELLPDKDRRYGASIVIPNTEKGIKALEGIEFCAEFDIAEVAKYNPSLIHSSQMPSNYDAIDEKIKRNVSIFSIGKQIYSPSIFNRIWSKFKRTVAKIRNGRQR